MSFLSVIKVEFIKLLRKRISLLLLLFFVPAVLFGIGSKSRYRASALQSP